MNKILFVLLIFAIMTIVCGIGVSSATTVDSNYLSDDGILLSSCSDNSYSNDYSTNAIKENSKTIDESILSNSHSIDKLQNDEKNPAYDEGNKNPGFQSEKSNKITFDNSGKSIKNAPIIKSPLSLEVDDLSCHVNDVVYINIKFNQSDVADGVLIYQVDDEVVATHNLSSTDSTLEFDTYGYAVGTHNIVIDYVASLNYEDAHDEAVLHINKHETYINDFVSQFDENNDIRVSFNLLSDDEYVEDATVSVYHDGDLIKTLTLNDSRNSFVIPNSYNYEIIKIKYDGDDYYEGYEFYELVNVDKKHLTVYLNSITAYQSALVNVSVILNNDTKINDGYIEFYIDDLLISKRPVTSSVENFELNLSNYVEGNYPVKVCYVDSNVFEDASYTTSLKVNKIKTVVYTNNITTYRNNTVSLKASVYNYVDDTNGGFVEFFIDDESIQTQLITNNTVVCEYTIPETMDYGFHQLKIEYHGNERYNDSSANAILILNKYKSTIYVKNTTIGDDGLIEVNLNLYSYDNTVDDGTVTCYVGGTPVASSPVENNTARIVLPDTFKAGEIYDITFNYTGSEYFNDSSITRQIQQNKTNTTISISKYLSNNNILNITSYIYAKDYSNINEGSVKIYLDDTLISTCEVKDNMINAVYDMGGLSNANYTIFVEYTGSKKYQQSNNSTTIEKIAHPKTIYINTNSTIKATPTQNITIKANLTDYESNLIQDTINASITFNNQSIDVQFINGIMEYNLTLTHETGKIPLQIRTQNTTEYKQATRNITININRNNTYISSTNTITSTKLEEILINATLNDNNGLIKTKTPVQIKIENKTIYQGFFNEGKMQYKLKLDSNYTQNQYNITLIAGKTTVYNNATKTITLRLNNRKTYIKSENIYSKKGDQLIFKATIYDAITQKQLTNRIPVVIKLNDLTIATVNATKGQLLYTYPNNYNSSTYNITIKSATTGIYETSQWNGTLTNTRDYIKVSTQNIYAKANSTITIRATIYKDDKLITDKIPIAIKINNMTIDTMNITNSKIECQYKLPDNLSKKEYNITIVTGDTQRYIQSTTNSKLIISKNYQQINFNNITSGANQKINIKANITDEKGNLIKSNEKINIKIAGLTIANVNAVNGIINYNYTLGNLKQGYYDLVIKTGQTNCYYHATAQNVLEIV